MLAAQALMSAATVALPVLAPKAAPDLGVPAAWVGLFVALVYGSSMVCGLAGGSLLRRWGAVRASQASLLCAGAALLLVALPHPVASAAGALLLGLGYGPLNPASSHLLDRVAPPQRRATIFSIKQTGVPLGAVLAGALLPSLALAAGWPAAIAALAACVLINAVPGFSREDRASLVAVCARPLVFMLAMPFLGAWYLGVMPADSRGWATGGNVPMTLFLSMAVGSSTLIGLYAIVAIMRQRLFVNGATASLLLALAFVATAGGEFVREGVRKPFTVRQYLYSNSIARDGVAVLRARGSTTDDPYPVRDAASYANEQLVLGARVFRAQCSVCHTLEGVNAVVELAGGWTIEQRRINIAQLQRTKPFMPPFAGTPEELEALVQLIGWIAAGRPTSWDLSNDGRVLDDIRRRMDEAGTGPGSPAATLAVRLREGPQDAGVRPDGPP